MRHLATSLVTVFTVFAAACTLTTDLDALSGPSSSSSSSGDDDDDTTSTTSSGSTFSGSSSGNASSSASSSSSSSSSSGGGGTSSTSSSTTSSSSTSSSSSSGDPGAGLLIDETFPAQDACSGGGWTGVNTAARTFRPEGNSPGSCQICVLQGDSDFFITKTVTTPRAGKLSAQMYVKQASGASATLALVTPNGTISSTKSISSDFTLFKTGTSTVSSGVSVTLKVGLTNAPAGTCIVVDDIQATLN